MLNFKIPKWLHILLAIVIVVIDRVIQLVQTGDLTGASAATIVSVLALVSLVVHSVDPSVAAKAAAFFVLVVGASTLQGCAWLASAPIVPVTPQNQAQVSACQSIATTHNGTVVADLALGAAGTGMGTISALESDNTTKQDLAIATAISAGAVAVGAGIVALTSAEFANSQCSLVVGDLASVQHRKLRGEPVPPGAQLELASPTGAY